MSEHTPDLDAQIDQLSDSIAGLLAENGRLKNDITGWGIYIQDLEAERAQLRAELDEYQHMRANAVQKCADLRKVNAKLVEALQRIADIKAGGPHHSAKDGMAAALSSLDWARDIARAALADTAPSEAEKLRELRKKE